VTVQGVESCTIVFQGGTSYSFVQTLLLYDVSFSHNAQRHRQTDRRQYDANSRQHCMQYNCLQKFNEAKRQNLELDTTADKDEVLRH